MQSEEQRLIDGLFSRLKEAESHSASRDASAEERIAGHIKEQPFAPYYMAQTILIQEAAIKQLNDRIQALESQVTQLQAAKPSSGGFLSGLFGGGQSRGSDPIPGAEQYGRPQAGASLSMLRRRSSRTTPLRRRAAAAVLWPARCKRRQASRAAWCWETC